MSAASASSERALPALARSCFSGDPPQAASERIRRRGGSGRMIEEHDREGSVPSTKRMRSAERLEPASVTADQAREPRLRMFAGKRLQVRFLDQIDLPAD